MPHQRTAAAVFLQEVSRAKVGGKVQQPDGDFRRQAVAGNGQRPEGTGAAGKFFRKIARAHVDADAGADAAQGVRFKAAAGFREYAAELFAVQIDVVDPFDLARKRRQRLYRLRYGHRRRGGEQRRLRKRRAGL